MIDGKQVNAFCLPGGKIFVFTGLLRLVENDDQLAAVISHEVAHALRIMSVSGSRGTAFPVPD